MEVGGDLTKAHMSILNGKNASVDRYGGQRGHNAQTDEKYECTYLDALRHTIDGVVEQGEDRAEVVPQPEEEHEGACAQESCNQVIIHPVHVILLQVSW
mgnify:CR=1 FL=1